MAENHLASLYNMEFKGNRIKMQSSITVSVYFSHSLTPTLSFHLNNNNKRLYLDLTRKLSILFGEKQSILGLSEVSCCQSWL